MSRHQCVRKGTYLERRTCACPEGAVGNIEVLNQYLHYQHQSFIISEIITLLFVLFVTYYHYHYNKLDYSGVVILVFKYAGWITQELLL